MKPYNHITKWLIFIKIIIEHTIQELFKKVIFTNFASKTLEIKIQKFLETPGI